MVTKHRVGFFFGKVYILDARNRVSDMQKGDWYIKKSETHIFSLKILRPKSNKGLKSDLF